MNLFSSFLRGRTSVGMNTDFGTVSLCDRGLSYIVNKLYPLIKLVVHEYHFTSNGSIYFARVT